MKVLLVLVAITAAVAAAPADVVPDEWVNFEYHRLFGIPSAERIRRFEQDPSRVVGGNYVSIEEHPYQAGLDIDLVGNTSSVCGASLITASRLLTAAHCWWDGFNQAWRFTVVLGSDYLYVGGVRVLTTDVIVHENWDRPTIANDIAIIIIPRVDYTHNIRPIRLPAGDEITDNFIGVMAVVSGYGRISDFQIGIPFGTSLSSASLPIITNEECREVFPNTVRETSICTIGANGANPCNGDSGGPLTITLDGDKCLVGVISFGSARGCQAGRPAAYSRVAAFLPWIQQHL